MDTATARIITVAVATIASPQASACQPELLLEIELVGEAGAADFEGDDCAVEVEVGFYVAVAKGQKAPHKAT
jgi:hypothetical protein